jgi:hypothetical protein
VKHLFRHSLLLIVAILGGCDTTPTVNLKPAAAGSQTLRVDFPHAYFAPAQSGEDQIVLLSDPIDNPSAPAGDTLPITNSPPLWQVLSIRLHWRSNASPKEDALVASNAVLHWYVYGKTVGNQIGVVHYVGTGTVSVDTDSTGAAISIIRADLKLADQHGEIRDPFKAFRISAAFHADNKPARVQQAMDDVAQAILQAEHSDLPPTTKP